ncbi:MAG: histidine kinase [Alphaproteobacteria bacterium PA4]|nr:MAG: histidine kinase [Alphaproteobacteria bacterium PA4]
MRVPGPLAMLLLDARGRAIAGNIAAWPADLPADSRFRRLDLTRKDRPGAETFALIASPLPDGHRLLVGRSLEEQERLTRTLTTSLLAAVGLSLVLAVGISLVLTRTIAARVQAIADVAGAVAAGDLTRRVALPAAGNRDAFDSLGDALNAMLARIESLLDELRSVTDGLAHDLRSPLTRMKARIDRMARGGDQSGHEIAAIGHEADALLAMLETSLEISRVEAGIGRDGFRQMDLAALVNDMVEMYEPLAEDNGVQLTALAATPVPVHAHRELLGRALSNLIDNALRYGASGGIIEVAAEATAGGARFSVADHGPGIARAAHGDALRRFGRLDVARPAGGAGLGLSLAAAIARLHGGALQLLSNRPGLRVTIDLPGEG